MNKTTKKDYAVLVDCIEQRTRPNGDIFYCIKDNTLENVSKIVKDVLFDNDYSDLDLSYEIMNTALNVLSDVEFKDLEAFDMYEYEGDLASIYTIDRLNYLNTWNEGEISDLVKEHSMMISEACAYWYAQQVEIFVNELKGKILTK